MKSLAVRELSIPGLYVIELPVFPDQRGSFKENYQQEKLTALGLPQVQFVQNNVAVNHDRGVTRGLHAEPWNKLFSLATGSAFGAWVDVRQGETYGRIETLKLTPEIAIFSEPGIACGYQTLEENVVGIYLVDDFWKPETAQPGINLFDPTLKISWPIAKERAIVSDKDLANPLFADLPPIVKKEPK